MTHPTKVTQTVNDQMSRGLATCGCGIQVQCQYPHCLLWKGGAWEEGRKGREEKEGQGEAMEERSGRKVRVRREGWWSRRLQNFSSLSQSHILASCESRNPMTTVLPECCCLSLGGRGEGGQTFTDEDPLKGEAQFFEVWRL